MQLSLQTFEQLLQRMSAAVQRSGSQLVDLSVGSMLRAILEANASIGLWVQWLIVRTLQMTRAATSANTDLDSWMADFSLVRLPAVAAQGTATFSRLSTSVATSIPVGTQVKSVGGSQVFSVLENSNNPAWQPSSSAYFLPTGVASVAIPIVAQQPGAAGNIMAGMISLISTAIPGVDFVTNTSALAGGTDAESDSQFRLRFQSYINSRSRATISAVAYAVSSMQQAMRYEIYENTNSSGAWQPGNFVVVVDDGSGQPSPSLLALAYSAIDAVRPIGSIFTVIPPVVTSVNATITMGPGQGPLTGVAIANVGNAVSNYIDKLAIGETLSLTRIVEIAYRAAQSPQNISSVTINGAAVDLVGSPQGVMRAGLVTVQ